MYYNIKDGCLSRSFSSSESSSTIVVSTVAMVFYIIPISLFIAVLSMVSAGPPNEKPFVLTMGSSVPPDEKPFDCPANEKYHKCDQDLCYKSCEHLKRPPSCPSLNPKCFKPACLCETGTLRNSEGKCVPYHDCPY